MAHEGKSQLTMSAKTLTGLEEVLAAELRELGAEDVKPFSRLVTFTGDKRLLYKVNFRSRTAIRVLVRLRKFNVRDEKHLYDTIKLIDWSQFLDKEGTLAIDPVVTNSIFTNSQFVALRTKDAIVDQFREQTGVRPSVDLENPDLRLNVHINKDIATVYLDASGDSLHKRGYRGNKNIAPISETLAAGIIMLSGWDRKSPFIDPMCGSGTFAIEAALMARKIAPGVFRKQFGFERWKDFDQALYREIFDEAEKEEIAKLPFEIVGSDSDEQSVRFALQNVKNAGLEKTVRIEHKKFEEQVPPKGPGMMVMNPPYGERMEVQKIHALYRMIGDTLRAKYAGYRACIISGHADAEYDIRLRPQQRVTMFNGPIECRLLQYEIRKAEGKKQNKPHPPVQVWRHRSDKPQKH